MKITNLNGISLPLAVWLLHDEYDHNHNPNYISATSLLKSTKQLVLSRRIPFDQREADVSDFIAARFGHSTHDSIQKAWERAGGKGMALLGYPKQLIDRLLINPSPDELQALPDSVPIWMEQRAHKELEGYTVGGKFDMVIDGKLFDFKTTSVYSYLKGNKDRDYSLQGSIYRWLNPELILDEHIYINFIFTDWQKAMVKSNPNYPKIKILEYPVPLLSLRETENFIRTKIKELKASWNAPQEQLPDCTEEELWMDAPTYKYYSDPAKAKDPSAKSSKNFDNKREADAYHAEKGLKGVVVTKPGEAKACLYCPAFSICEQRKRYHAE